MSDTALIIGLVVVLGAPLAAMLALLACMILTNRENKRWARNLLATVNRERLKRGDEPLYPELDKVNFPRRR